MQQQQPVFIVPSPNAFQQLDIIKQQIETLEHTIRQAEANDQDVAKSTRDSLAFLRAQHENLSLWQRTMIPQTFPPGMIFVASGGQAYYHTRLPDASGMQESAFLRSMQENASMQRVRPVSPVHIPKIPSIEPIKTLQYPTRRSSRPKKSAGSEVTVTIRTRNGKDPVVKTSASPGKTTKQDKTKKQDKARRSEALAGLNPFQDAMVAAGHAIPRPPENGRQIDGNWVIDEANDSVRINGRLYTPELFFWLTDPNGNKFFVCIPFSKWDSDDQCWVMRILFSNGTASLYRGTTTNGRFEAVRNLQKLVDPLLARLWYVKVSLHGRFVQGCSPANPPPETQPTARVPKATLDLRESDALHYPLPKKFDGYKPGDSVFVRRETDQRAYIKEVYTLPNRERVYLVFAPSENVPDFEVDGVFPFVATVGGQEIMPPCVSWHPLHQEDKCVPVSPPRPKHPTDVSAGLSRWWDRLDMSNPSESSSYWPVPCGFWQQGHLVTVPTSVLDLSRYWPVSRVVPSGRRHPVTVASSSPRKLGRIEYISAYNQYADVVFPLDPSRSDLRLRARVPVVQLLGPLIGTDLAAVRWPEDRPKRPCPPSPPPIEVGANAVPEVVEAKTRVLSDPSSCLSSRPSKVHKTEPVLQDEPEKQVGPEKQDGQVEPEKQDKQVEQDRQDKPEILKTEQGGPEDDEPHPNDSSYEADPEEEMDVDQFLREDSPDY